MLCNMLHTHLCTINMWHTACGIAVYGNVRQDSAVYGNIQQDVAFFLLARGPFAWLGWGQWGMTWPFNPEPAHGTLPPLPHGVPRPVACGLTTPL